MSIADVGRTLDNKKLETIIKKIDAEYLDQLNKIMKQTWPIMRKLEKNGVTDAKYLKMKHIFFAAGEAAMEYIDHSGFVEWLKENIDKLRGFSYMENIENFAIDIVFLTDDGGIPFHKVKSALKFTDDNLDQLIDTIKSPDFSLTRMCKTYYEECDKKGGKKWEHASPVNWRKAFMVAMAVANVGLAVGSGGTGGGLAVDSVVMAVGGVVAT